MSDVKSVMEPNQEQKKQSFNECVDFSFSQGKAIVEIDTFKLGEYIAKLSDNKIDDAGVDILIKLLKNVEFTTKS